MGDPVVMLSLYPEFPKDVMSSMTSHGEFLFVVDRSGSMECPMHLGSGSQDRIGSARDTLLLLLKSLPMGCYFNIIGFGSSYESFFSKSVEYSQKTMDEALQKVKEMRADLGGTEILQPLKHIYSQPCLPDQPRQLFLFTDGEVGNTKEVLDLVKTNAGSHSGQCVRVCPGWKHPSGLPGAEEHAGTLRGLPCQSFLCPPHTCYSTWGEIHTTLPAPSPPLHQANWWS
ncbi:von Willebrand factor A domain-containing protein 5A isoform X2 [Salmo trutta]|uniref:von Willebrand factor A domain-containing protein 5A isoform X2 n=1 Tax=Salmo trutta TaxID=8032 RepID=UPI001132393F|nr:von Willebrand factor A domain-containing protein 5A-like isoform X2 [Salmo trutta]